MHLLLVAVQLAQPDVAAVAAGQSVLPALTVQPSTNWNMPQPRTTLTDDGLLIAGMLCRKANRPGLSPTGLRAERVAADGTITEIATTALPRLSQQPDQPCIRYTVKLSPAAAGDTVRLCLSHAASCAAPP